MLANNLVIATVGDSSVHKTWIEAANFKNFDLCLIYFGKQKDKFYSDADFYIEERGYKFPLISKVLEASGLCHDYYWLPDDDIQATTADVNLIFELMKSRNFYIAQPSLKKDCPHTWPHTTTKENNVFRETQFIEIMCPIFTRKSLQMFLPHFTETHTGWGLDRLWSDETLKMNRKLGIFDIVSVNHSRKMGAGFLYNNLKKDNVDYKKEYRDFLKKYNLKHVKQNEKVNWR